MSADKEKLRDAVIEAARRHVGKADGPPTFDCAKVVDKKTYNSLVAALRALDAAGRPRFKANNCDVLHEGRLCCTTWTLSRLMPEADLAALIARLLNEHFEKEQP